MGKRDILVGEGMTVGSVDAALEVEEAVRPSAAGGIGSTGAPLPEPTAIRTRRAARLGLKVPGPMALKRRRPGVSRFNLASRRVFVDDEPVWRAPCSPAAAPRGHRS